MDTLNTIARPQGGKSVTVAYTGTHGVTSALPETTTGIRVVCTTDAFIEIGLAPVAVANTGLLMIANIPEYFPAYPNEKVSAIQLSAGGNLYVTPF